MKDARISKLAKQLINYSVELKKNEKILIEVIGNEIPLTKELIRETYKAGGIPYVSIKNNEILRVLLEKSNEAQIIDMADFELKRMKKMDAYIGLRVSDNINEMSSVSDEKIKLYMEKYSKPLHSLERVNNTKWCILRYPNNSMAQLAGMSTEEFEDFYFKVCNLDYSKLSKAMEPLAKLMEKTENVKIKGSDTDISFSIKGLPAIKCEGKQNIPDGEVFTAPVKDSVNGYITYNTPSVHNGTVFENIRFEFKNGKIVKATANETEKLNAVLNTDEGARYIGEFSLGFNPYIIKPMKDTLFDEKIAGSIHFTPGSAYDECDNGNKSAVHWDLVAIQTPEYGGGEIWFDGKLIRKDGVFVIKELMGLNPENLK